MDSIKPYSSSTGDGRYSDILTIIFWIGPLSKTYFDLSIYFAYTVIKIL